MRSTIFLPKTIKVGYQERSDTYTGQLAYIIYYDQKGVLRKEKSWEGWRDKKIEPHEFSNEPTSGFVLNKKVGDYVSDWNHRQAYVRVYDPRNFEFEITIPNLLYILENANSIKGKGLEGDFVYGWDGTELLLVPVASPDYKEITEFNEILQANNRLKSKDLILGATYRTKTDEQWIYMGRFDYHTTKSEKVEDTQRSGWYKSYKYINVKVNKGKHYFFVREVKYDRDSKMHFVVLTLKSLGDKFIDTVSSTCVSNYAELFEKLERQTEYSPIDESKDEYIPYSFEEFSKKVDDNSAYCYDSLKRYIRVGKDYYKKNQYYIYDQNNYTNKEVAGSLEEIFVELQPTYKRTYLENGKLYKEGK